MESKGRWAKIAGFLGVIASLLVVADEIKQPSDIAIAEVYQQREGGSMTNVGLVVYTRDETQGGFESKWSHSTNGSGTGRLTGGPVKGIAGTYKAVYFNEQGKEKFSIDLIIKNQGDHYALTYTMDGETICIGLGNEVSGKLVAGYSFVDEKWLDRPQPQP